MWIGVAVGLFVGWLATWIFFRQRNWVMQQRLWDYEDRRSAVCVAEDKNLICPVCHSRSLHRSANRGFGVFIGLLFRRAPYRCERCFAVTLHYAPWLFEQGSRSNTYAALTQERKRFAADLQLARKMKRLYPDMFESSEPRRPSRS